MTMDDPSQLESRVSMLEIKTDELPGVWSQIKYLRLMVHVLLVIAVLLTFAVAAKYSEGGSPLLETALADRDQFDREDYKHFHYLVADDTTARVLGWVLSSTSRTREIELCLPLKIAEGLWRIDIRNLGWRQEDMIAVCAAHPYGGYSALIRGDWLLTDILDTQLSAQQHEDGIASYYRLLYAGQVPTTEAAFLSFWEVDQDKSRRDGQIEGLSQVNRRGRRLITTAYRPGGYFYITRDSDTLDTNTDPLEKPDGSFEADGSEAIVGFRKKSTELREMGTVQFYHLFDGTGKSVNEAPVQLVEDHTRFRNVASIRTWGSCLKCHIEGIRPLKVNALVDLSEKYGVAIFSSDPAALRDFHFGDLSLDISRNQEDYEAAVRLHTLRLTDDGELDYWTPKQLIEAVESVVRGYDAPLDLERAAAELGVAPDLLVDTIRHYGQANPIPAGIAVLAGGGQCSRDLFAQQYSLLNDLLKVDGKPE